MRRRPTTRSPGRAGCRACRARRFMPGATGPRPPRRRGGGNWPRRCAGSSGPGAGRRVPRVAAQLNREGHRCSVGLVADLMRELGLRACQPRAYKRTTLPGEQPVASPDLIGRDFTAAAPGTRLVGDITYLRPVRAGCTWRPSSTCSPGDGHWLAARGAHAHHPRRRRAGDGRHPWPRRPGVIFHSDVGAQYTSAELAGICEAPASAQRWADRGVLGQRRGRVSSAR